MDLVEELVLQLGSRGILLGCMMMLLVIYLFSSDSQQKRNEPPGPKPLPILGNLLELDLQRLYLSLCSVDIALTLSGYLQVIVN